MHTDTKSKREKELFDAVDVALDVVVVVVDVQRRRV